MPNLTQAKKNGVTYYIKDATAREEISNLKIALDSVANDNVPFTRMTGVYVSDGRYVASATDSCIYVIDLTSIVTESSLYITLGNDANRCRLLYTNTPASEVQIATIGTYVDLGNTTKKATIEYTTWSQYKTLIVGTNYMQIPLATLTVNAYLSIAHISEENCTFFKKCEQYLKVENASLGFWNISGGSARKSASENTHAFEPFKLKGGETYRFIDVYGYFSLIANQDGSNAVRLTDNITNNWSGTYTPVNDCYLFASAHNNYFGTSAMIINSTKYLPDEYIEGVYYTYLTANTEYKTLDIHVKKDGTGDYTSVVNAVNFANSQKGNYPINIYIHTGDYDILDELGGNDFLTTVLDSVDERQGLVLKANNINLIGVGLVTLRYELPDNVEYYQSSRTSCLNLREFSNRVENLTLIAKNCRYAIHDETNGGNPYIHRVMKNLRCIHKGNAEGLWPYPTVMGGGAGGGSTYDVINCQFITSAYHQAFSYHSGANEEASMFNIDGCVGSVKNDAPSKISFRLSYHGTNRKGVSVGNIKNCSGNGQTVVQPESSGDTDNNIEMYVNGWETIEPIEVNGNE